MLFLSAGRLSEIQGHEKSLYRLRGAALKDKLAGVCFTIGGLSMVGIPLLAGFNMKYFLAEAAMHNEIKMWIALIALAASSVLNALYYIPAIIALWSPSPFMKEGKSEKNIGYWVAAPVLTALVVYLGVNSKTVVNVIELGLELLK